MQNIPQYHLEPQTGVGFLLKKGQRLRVVDPKGEQVSDLIAFAQADKGEWLSSGRSLDYNNTIYMTTGHILYSNKSNPMFTILEDTVGRHDFLLTPCSRDTWRICYGGDHDDVPGCHGNLAAALAPFRIAADAIPTCFNVFMRVEIAAGGRLAVQFGGTGNVPEWVEAVKRATARPEFGEVLSDFWPWHFRGLEETQERLKAAGFEDVRCWFREAVAEPPEPRNWISATGTMPETASPSDAPTMLASASGVSTTRPAPCLARRPVVARNMHPSFPTSSPMTRSRGSRRLSSAIASFTASPYVSSRSPMLASGRPSYPKPTDAVGQRHDTRSKLPAGRTSMPDTTDVTWIAAATRSMK